MSGGGWVAFAFVNLVLAFDSATVLPKNVEEFSAIENGMKFHEFSNETWSLDCGNHFRIGCLSQLIEKYNTKTTRNDSINFTFRDKTKLSFSIFNFETLSHETCRPMLEWNGNMSEHEDNIKTSLVLRIFDKKEDVRSVFSIRKQRSFGKIEKTKWIFSIGHDRDETILAIFKLRNFRPIEGPNTSMSRMVDVDVPHLKMRMNMKHFQTGESENSARIYDVIMYIDGKTVMTYQHQELNQSNIKDNYCFDYVNDDDKFPEIRARARAAVFKRKWKLLNPIRRGGDSQIALKSRFLSYMANRTLYELGNGAFEEWIFVECESSPWPQLNFSLSQMTIQNHTTGHGWEAVLARFPWGLISVTANFKNEFMTNKTIKLNLFTDHLISLVVVDFIFRPFAANIIFKSPELEWTASLEETQSGFSLIIHKTDFWTQFKETTTLIQILVNEETSAENQVEAQFVAEIVNYVDLHNLLHSLIGYLKEKTRSWELLFEDHRISNGFKYLAQISGLDLDESFLKKFEHFEYVIQKSASIMTKNFQFIEKLEWHRIFLEIFNRLDGTYKESEGGVFLKINISNLPNLMIVVIDEFRNLWCPRNDDSSHMISTRKILQLFWKFTSEGSCL